MITFFVCLLLFLFLFFFFFRELFSFSNWRKKIKIKTEYYLKLVQLFFGHNFLFTEGDTLKVTLSKLSKLSVSNYFLIHVEVQFYSFLFFYVCFPLFCGMVMLIMSLEQREIKFKPKKKIEPEHIHIGLSDAFLENCWFLNNNLHIK